jgi:xanthine/uracil permease
MAKKEKNKKKKNAEIDVAEGVEADGAAAVVKTKTSKAKKVKKKKEIDPIIFPIVIVIMIIGMLLAKIVYETWMFSKETNYRNKNSATEEVIDASFIHNDILDSENDGENTVSFAYLNLDNGNYDSV